MRGPPAVVVGMALNGLGVARSLAAGGVRVIGLDPDPWRPEAWTRHARVRFVPACGGPALVEALVRLARETGERPVLYLTMEETVATVTAERDTIERHYRVVLPPTATVRALTDKLGFQALAELHGCPVPRAVELRGTGDLAGTAGLAFPCALKPNAHVAAYQARFKKAYKVRSLAELEALYARIHPVHPLMIVQEWIEGADGDIFFCLQWRGADGRRHASFTGRKIRAWPPQTGGTASCTAAPEAAGELAALTDRFLDATGCVGMVGMEYKRDRRGGRFVMVEPTVARTDHQAEVATLNGVNLPLVAYRVLVGERPRAVPAPPRRARIWRDPLADRMSAAAQGDAALPAGRLVDAYARAADPLPGLALRLRQAGQLASRGAGVVEQRRPRAVALVEGLVGPAAAGAIKAALRPPVERWRRWSRRRELATSLPHVTIARLVDDLERLRLPRGAAVLVHSSLKRLGFVEGGAATVVAALVEVVVRRRDGTLALPCFSIDGSMHQTLLADRVFDVRATPTTLGAIPEAFRRHPGVVRSVHPTHSLAALGRDAAWVVADHHRCGTSFGAGSPMMRLKELDGWLIGLGTHLGTVTFYHCLEDVERGFPVPVYSADSPLPARCVDAQGTPHTLRVHAHSGEVSRTRIDHPAGEGIRAFVTGHLERAAGLSFFPIGDGEGWVVRLAAMYTACAALMRAGITIYSTREQAEACLRRAGAAV